MEDLEVGLLPAPVAADDDGPREVEIFALEMPLGAGLEDIAQRERSERHEDMHETWPGSHRPARDHSDRVTKAWARPVS